MGRGGIRIDVTLAEVSTPPSSASNVRAHKEAAAAGQAQRHRDPLLQLISTS